MKNSLLRRLLSATYVLLGLATVQSVRAQITPVSLTAINAPYTQDFNTLASSGTSSTLPTGFTFVESGGSANTTYSAGTGTDNTGNTYSFGATSATERALGGLRSATLNPTIGASFVNNTGTTINSINIAYTGEQWRLGATGRVDRLDFQYSTNASSLTNGTYIDFNDLDFTAPRTTGGTGALNGNAGANSTAITALITGLSIPPGGTFWIRYADFLASGSDDGLAIDDFSLTPTCPTITATLTGTSTICAGTSTTLAATITGGTSPYTVRVTDGTNASTVTGYISGSAITITPTTSKTYTIVLVRDASNCTATVSGTATVTVETITAAITNLANNYCKNAPPVTLTGTPTGAGFTGVFTVDGSTATTFDPASLTVGNHTVVYSVTNTTGCSSTTSQTVGVKALPTPNLTGLANNYCKDAAPVTLTGTPMGGSFTIDGVAATGFDPATLATGQSYTVVYSVTNVNGCSASTSETFRVRPLPMATLTSSNSLNCAITSTTLTAGAGPGYTYAFSGPGFSSSDPTSNTAVVTAGGTYTVTVTSAFGCTAVNTTTVVSDVTSPTATITGTLTVCAGLSTALNASGGTSYTWSTGETTPLVTVTAGTYSVTVTAGNGCTALASATVTPVANPTATIGGTLTVITGGSTTLTASGGTSFTWSTGETTAAVSVTAGTYSVTVANASGCVSSTTATVTEVNTAPVATANNNQTATVGLAFSYTVSAFTDAETPTSLTYSASISPPNGFTFDPATRVIAGTPSLTGVSSVTVTASDFGGLSANTTFTITVSPPTCGTLTVPGDYQTIQSAINAACSGAVIQVAAGTYTEQLTIPKNLTILGAGVGNTIVKAPGNLAAGILNASHRNIIEINNSAAVTITGINMNGPVASGGCGELVYGININGGAGLNLSNASVTNIYQTPTSLFGCQSGFGIRAGFGLLNSPGSLTATNVTVTNYQKAGIIIDGVGSNGVVTNATVTGVGATTGIAQNGIQISRGATGNVQSSTVTGNSYSDINNTDTQAAGLLAFENGTITASGNSFTGNNIGLYAGGPGLLTANNNSFSSNDYASTYAAAPAAFTGSGNTFDKQVTNNNKVGTVYSAIQVAVNDATAGDVISVGAGTFVENVTIPKSLTLLGANSGINPNTGSRVAETIVLPATTGATDAVYPASIVTVFSLTGNANNAVIDGFTLDGANPAISDPIKSVTLNGVEVDAAAGISGSGAGVTGGTVRNNIIKNFAYDGVDFSGDGTPTFNTIANNSFDNIAYTSTATAAGLAVLISDNGYASITGNTATKVRAGVQTNSFYQPSPGGVPTISGNTFTAYRYGIFHNLHQQSATGFVISNNTITGSTGLSGTAPLVGIALSSIESAVPVTVTGNTVNSGFPYGIESWNTPTTGTVVLSGGTVQGSVAGVRITTRNRFGDATSSKLLVSGVTIANSPVGILAFDDPASANGITASVTVTDNTQITGTGAFTAVAISGADASANITGNASSFAGNGSGTGVDVNGGTASVNANRITRFATGVNVSNGGQLTGVANNFIMGNTDGITYAADAGTTQGIVLTNDLSGNTNKAIVNSLTSTTINANCNWFGGASATLNPTYVTGNVSTTQVLANGTDEDIATAGFQNTSCFTPPTAPMLTISPAPQLGPNTSYCIGENPTVTSNYTTGTNSFTVQARSDGSTTVTTGNSVTISQGAGAYDIFATNSQNGYTSPVSTTFVQIAPVVTSFIADKAAYCVGETVSLTALGCNVTASSPNLHRTLLRSLDGSNNENQGTAFLPDGVTSYTYSQFATTTPTTYTVTAECVNTGTGQVCGRTQLVITANPLPVATLSSSNTLTCAAPTATLTAGGGQSYVFDGPGIVSQNGSATALVNAAGTYSVTVTSAAGCVSTTTTTVSSDTAVPTATLMASNSLNCAVTSATLTANASGGTSYTYTFGNGAAQIGTTNQAVATAGGPYSVTVTTANGCSTVATTTIMSDTAAPAATLVSSNTLTCSVTSATLTATGGVSYAFSGPGLVSSDPIAGTAVVNTSGMYSVTATAPNGCSSTTTTSVISNTATPMATLTTQGSSTLTCAQTSVTLVAGGGVSYTFSGTGIVSQTSSGTAVVDTRGIYSVTATAANGCTDVATVRVFRDTDKPTATLATLGSATLTCAQTSVTLTASATAGTAPYTYLFSPDATTISATQATVTTAGLYSVTAIGANGCFDVASMRVFRDAGKPTATLTASNSGTMTCNQTSLTLTASATGDSSPYTYLFSSDATAISATQATVTTAGLYSVTAIGTNGCFDVANVRVFRDAGKPTATLTVSGSGTLTCNQTSLTLTASATAGTGPYTYLFSPDATPVSATQATVNMAGVYSVTAIGTNGCFDVANVRIYRDTDKPTATLATLGSATLTCAQTSVTLTASATGSSSYTYAFSTGAASTGANQATVSTAGLYSVTVTGANGCTDVANVRIYSDTDKPTASLATVGGATITCNQPSVTLTASATGDSSPYTYAFSAGATPVGPNQATVSTPGVYTVTVTGANGCTDMATERVFRDNARPTANLTGTTTICAGGTANLVATVSGGTTPYSLTYSNGTSASAISNYTSGTNIPVSPTATSTYTIAVNGANGCTATITGSGATVTVNPLPTASLTTQGSSTLTCAQTSVTLVAGGGTSYAFAGPGIVSRNGNTAIVNAAGTYSVTVTSAAGCSAVSTTMVSSNTASPTVSLVASGTISCASPSVTLTASTNARSDTYAFSGPNGVIPSTGNTAVVSTGGTYSVTATSTNGCTSTTTTTVAMDTAVPSATLVVSGAITCASPTATLTANPTTRSGTDTYAFSGPSGPVSSTGNMATVMAAGTYSVTVTSANGCLSTATATVVSNTAVTSLTLTSSNNLSCGVTSATLTASPDPTVRSAYTYVFSPGATQISTNQATVTMAGLYSVTATSVGNGCSVSATTNITSDTTLPTATLISSNSLNCGVTSATLTANIAGRSGTDTFAFSTGASQIGTSNQAIVTTGGPYSVTVTATNGCTNVATTTVVSDNAVPSATLVVSGAITCASPTATLTANPAARSGTDTYAFSGPSGPVSSTGNMATVMAAGTYSVTVTSANGCLSTATATVVSNTAVTSLTLTSSNNLSCGVTSATLTASPDPTVRSAYTYVFSAGATQISTNQATVTMAGLYSVTATSVGNGCSVSATTSVTADVASATATLSVSNSLNCGVTSATLTATGGATYAFSGPGLGPVTGNMAVVNAGGLYSVTVTAANGCSAVANVTVISDVSTPMASLAVSNSLNCGVTSATLTAAGGGSYAFSGPGLSGVSSNTALATTAGMYSVTVTAANGCSAVANVTVISDVTGATASLMASNSLNCGVTSATLTAAGGTSYAFSGPGLSQTGTGNTVVVNAAGMYSVTVTAASGCSAVANVTVISNTAATTPTITGLASSFCKNAGSVTLTGSPVGGSFTIDGTPTTTLDPASLMAGQHTVTYSFTNANQCSATVSQIVVINQVPQSPVIQTQGGQSNVTVSQNTGDVVLFVSGCAGGTITWSGGAANSLTVSTANTGVFTYTATCQANGCTSPIAVATVTVGSTSLRVLHRDASNGNLNTNAIYPYLMLDNVGTTPIPYSELTVRYWLTVENPAPVTNLPVYNASFGAGNVQPVFVPLNPARTGATGYVEYRFTPGAGSLPGGTNSGSIDNAISKQDYSPFNQADDYSYVLNRDFTPNTHITAYRNGVLIWGTEPAGTPGVVTPLTLTASANPTTILTTGSTTLSASVSGGTSPYTYTFSGPGTITPNGNTASVSGLPAGVQTFTVFVSDATTPVSQTISTTVSVTVNTPTPANTPPTTTVNANQTATVGVAFSYTANAFTDAETPNNLTYGASINPANGLTYNPVTRVLAGTPTATGVSSVTLTASDPGGLSTSTIFTVTVNTPPVVGTASLRVLHRDASNGQLNTNAIYPYFSLDNRGTQPLDYSRITVRYWLTVENPAPVTNLPVYGADFGAANVLPVFVPISPARQNATGYVEYSFKPAAGSLAGGANSGGINTAISKQDYSAFDQANDYSYMSNRDFTPNDHFTAYYDGTLVWGTEPPVSARLATAEVDQPLRVEVMGNPVQGGEVAVKVTGAAGQPLRLRVTDLNGHLVGERNVERAGSVEQQRLSIGQQAAGLLLIQVSTPTQTQTVKVLKVD